MSLPQQQIRIVKPEQPMPKVDRRVRGEIESAMAIIRMHVDEARDRETGKYILAKLSRQCEILAKRFDLRVE